ncbi:MAG: hypothetical protein KF836_06585 [Fimbriimonadaceae bacterium]|nr:hypothetical protein [Fimbriimonadaceae bacterium]
MSTEEPIEPPKTTDVSIVWIALAIVAVALVAGLFAGKKLVGNTLRALEKEAVPSAQKYLEVLQSGQSTSDLLAPAESRKEFDETEFKSRLDQALGKIARSKAIDAKVGDGEPPSIVITLRAQDDQKREAEIIIAMITVKQKMLVKNAVIGK